MQPKVLVGCPSSDYHAYCLKEYVTAVKAFTYPNFDVCIADNSKDPTYYKHFEKEGFLVIRDVYHPLSKERVIHSRNMIRKKVLDEGYDYFLSLEQDVIAPPDIIERLLAHGKLVVTGIYFNHNTVPPFEEKELIAQAFKMVDEKTQTIRWLEGDDLWKPGLIPIVSAGLGCVLIHRSVLENVSFRYDPTYESWDDRFFFIDLYEQKIPVYADNTVKCKHLTLQRPWKWKDLRKLEQEKNTHGTSP